MSTAEGPHVECEHTHWPFGAGSPTFQTTEVSTACSNSLSDHYSKACALWSEAMNVAVQIGVERSAPAAFLRSDHRPRYTEPGPGSGPIPVRMHLQPPGTTGHRSACQLCARVRSRAFSLTGETAFGAVLCVSRAQGEDIQPPPPPHQCSAPTSTHLTGPHHARNCTEIRICQFQSPDPGREFF